MKLTLAENIRSFRKDRRMTQEQLAAVLGVTVGAVYKWESGLSVPDLSLIVEMADFFDVSVDVLLGYRMKSNRLEDMLERIAACCRTLDPAALTEAEKALGKYPHSFRVVYACAGTYLTFGISGHDPEKLRRALDLFEQARLLLPQNDDPRVSDITLCGNLALAHFQLGDREKAIELIRQKNTGGIYSSAIGAFLATYMQRPEEAATYLGEGLLGAVSDLFDAITGYVFLFRSRKDWKAALAITEWGVQVLTGLKINEAGGFMDKAQAEMLLLLAYARKKTGQAEASLDALKQAAECAARFDSMPDYTLRTVRFIDDSELTAVYDILDATASGGIACLLEMLGDAQLTAQWKEISRHA